MICFHVNAYLAMKLLSKFLVKILREDLRNPDVSIDCGDGCSNRAMSTECDPRLCRCGLLCRNRRFQLHQHALVYPTKEGGKGWGLTAGEFIPAGTFVIQYIGEVLSIHSEEGRRRTQEYSKSNCTYMMKLQKDEVIDPTYKGNMARFINHSCDPNCETQKWNVQGEVCVGIFSIKDIKEGQELSFDYKFEAYKTPFTRCLCGTKKCKGYLGLVPSDYTYEEWDEKVESMPCEICGSKEELNGNTLILCDICNNGFHIRCLTPPLSKVPDDVFFCKNCIEKEKEKEKQKEIKNESETNISDLRKVLEREGKIKSGGGFYLEKRKRPGRPRKRSFEMDEEDCDDLKVYNELYEIQKGFQIELIKEMNEEVKGEIKKIYEESDQELSDSESESENEEITQDKDQNRTKFDLIVEKVFECFKPFLENKIRKSLRKRDYIAEISKQGEVTRRNLPVSQVEVTLFRKYLFHEIIKKLKIKLFWNMSGGYNGDVFKKNNEFNVTSNEQQYEFIRNIFTYIDLAIKEYKKVCGFTSAIIKIPAILLKRVVGEYQKTVHYINATYQVRMLYDKRFITDECYPLHMTTDVTLKGIKDNILESCKYLQSIVDGLYVERIFMGSSDIKIIISNLMPIKQQIHPAEVRCCRDNALRDINHPFYTIYYKNKEVAFVGTKEEVERSIKLIKNEILREKKIKKNTISLNYLIPKCDKNYILQIKNDIEDKVTKLIIYDPLPPRKNISLTLITTYEQYDQAYKTLKNKLDDLGIFNERFEDYQVQILYQMTKYFFKYLQNYFQTFSTIFMKAWDSLTTDFSKDCNKYNSSFEQIKTFYIKDHELKFYMLSVIEMVPKDLYQNLGMKFEDIFLVLKLILNNSILGDKRLNAKNYQSILPISDDFAQFLESFNPVNYINHYSKDNSASFENKLKKRLLSGNENKNFGNRSSKTSRMKFLPKKLLGRTYESVKKIKERGEFSKSGSRNSKSSSSHKSRSKISSRSRSRISSKKRSKASKRRSRTKYNINRIYISSSASKNSKGEKKKVSSSSSGSSSDSNFSKRRSILLKRKRIEQKGRKRIRTSKYFC